MIMGLCSVTFNRLPFYPSQRLFAGAKRPRTLRPRTLRPRRRPSISSPTQRARPVTHTHWHVDLRDRRFMRQATGRSSRRNRSLRLVRPASTCANQGIGEFTWTRLGSDALLVNLTVDQFCGPTFTNFANITGSISNGQFTTAWMATLPSAVFSPVRRFAVTPALRRLCAWWWSKSHPAIAPPDHRP